MLTLNNRKVYIGWVFAPPLLKRPTFVVVLPTRSGFRHADDLTINWTTDYVPAYLATMARVQAGEALTDGACRLPTRSTTRVRRVGHVLR